MERKRTSDLDEQHTEVKPAPKVASKQKSLHTSMTRGRVRKSVVAPEEEKKEPSKSTGKK